MRSTFRSRLAPLVLLPLGAFALAAHGAPEAPAPSGRVTASANASKGERDAVRWFNMLDINGDGRISPDEARIAFRIRPSLEARFRATDTNGDGYLTEDEIRAAAERKRAARQARRQAEKQTQPTVTELAR